MAETKTAKKGEDAEKKVVKPTKVAIDKKTRAPLTNPWAILQYPHLTEKSIGLVESKNALVFVVDPRMNKKQVKWAVEQAFSVRVINVNVLNDRKNRKRAFVTLAKENNALDIATRLGMI